MAFLLVRSTQTATGSGTSLTLTLSGTPAANNFLLINAKIGTTSSNILGVSDNASVPNTYNPVGTGVSNSFVHLQSYGVQVSGGATQVTVSWSGVTSARVTIDEWSGGEVTNATLFDTFAVNSGGGSPAAVALTPSGIGKLIAAGIGFTAAQSLTPGTGYSVSTNATSIPTLYKLSGTTSEIVDSSFGATAWTEIASSFNPAGGAAPAAVIAKGRTSRLAYLGIGSLARL